VREFLRDFAETTAESTQRMREITLFLPKQIS
jgi:hypothetical protein